MSDLISREDAIKAVTIAVLEDKDEIEALEALPSADAEPSLKAIKRQIDEHWYLDPPSAEQGWIPCSEKLPDDDGCYLVTSSGTYNDIIDIAYYTDGLWHKASRILAWMPLPKPWKGADDED